MTPKLSVLIFLFEIVVFGLFPLTLLFCCTQSDARILVVCFSICTLALVVWQTLRLGMERAIAAICRRDALIGAGLCFAAGAYLWIEEVVRSSDAGRGKTGVALMFLSLVATGIGRRIHRLSGRGVKTQNEVGRR